MAIREEVVAKKVADISHIRAMGRPPFPKRTPDSVMKDLTQAEKNEVRKRLGEE